MSLKAPYIVEEAKEALAEGHSVVIGLQTTEEANNAIINWQDFVKRVDHQMNIFHSQRRF
jgi:hypothetical protein